MRFLDLEFEDPVPDATTIWLFRDALVEAGLIDKLFARFGQHLEAAGYIARGGQIIDATIVSVPKQRNTKDENEAIKAGKTPEGWETQPAKNAQKEGALTLIHGREGRIARVKPCLADMTVSQTPIRGVRRVTHCRPNSK
jgi:hypothetical protein